MLPAPNSLQNLVIDLTLIGSNTLLNLQSLHPHYLPLQPHQTSSAAAEFDGSSGSDIRAGKTITMDIDTWRVKYVDRALDVVGNEFREGTAYGSNSLAQVPCAPRHPLANNVTIDAADENVVRVASVRVGGSVDRE